MNDGSDAVIGAGCDDIERRRHRRKLVVSLDASSRTHEQGKRQQEGAREPTELHQTDATGSIGKFPGRGAGAARTERRRMHASSQEAAYASRLAEERHHYDNVEQFDDL